jgi:hypothetical protein
MPPTENDLKDLLAERGAVPGTRLGRLDEVHRRIRRRRTARAATGIAASAAAVAAVALVAPAIAGHLGGSDGLTVAGNPTPTATSSPAPRPTVLIYTPGKLTPTQTAGPLPPAEYTITPTGGGFRVRISEMGDLAGLREDLQQRGVRVVADPSSGFEECEDGDYSDGPRVVDPGDWEFVVRPDDFGPDRELRLWNGPAYGELLFLHYCKSLR